MMSDTHPFDPLKPTEITEVGLLRQRKEDCSVNDIIGSKSCARTTAREMSQLSRDHFEGTSQAGNDSLFGKRTSKATPGHSTC